VFLFRQGIVGTAMIHESRNNGDLRHVLTWIFQDRFGILPWVGSEMTVPACLR